MPLPGDDDDPFRDIEPRDPLVGAGGYYGGFGTPAVRGPAAAPSAFLGPPADTSVFGGISPMRRRLMRRWGPLAALSRRTQLAGQPGGSMRPQQVGGLRP